MGGPSEACKSNVGIGAGVAVSAWTIWMGGRVAVGVTVEGTGVTVMLTVIVGGSVRT